MSSQNEQTLLSELGEARERLDGLVQDLRTIDAELESLSPERRRYRLLHEVCAGLEELGELEGAGLFWGEQASQVRGNELVRLARGRVDAFEKRLREIEERRQEIIEEIEREHENTEFLEEDLYQARLAEEQRRLEWIIERETSDLPTRPSVMPWTRGGEDDKRLRKSVAVSLMVSLLLGVVIPQIDLPLPERSDVIEVPERLARLIREARPLPPPPPPREEPRPEEKPEPEESPLVAEAATSRPSPDETPKPGAKSKGILAFRERFSGLAASGSSARLGAQAPISSAGEAASGQPTRALVTTQAPGSSGGINLAALSRDVGGGGGQPIEGVQITRATSSIGGVSETERPRADGPALSRTDEEIQIVFDRYKAALYRLYNRELRRDPTLKGQMVLRIRIEPDGTVSLCALQATDMDAPQLVAQVVDRVRTFDFGAKDGIPAITILYPIDFLPAT